jgi:hypothetical protein
VAARWLCSTCGCGVAVPEYDLADLQVVALKMFMMLYAADAKFIWPGDLYEGNATLTTRLGINFNSIKLFWLNGCGATWACRGSVQLMHAYIWSHGLRTLSRRAQSGGIGRHRHAL